MRIIDRAELFLIRGVPWVLSFEGSRHYRKLTEAELVTTRKSDTIIIFGSGSSINDISVDEWALFQSHDTMSFNWFINQRQVDIDYHLVREVTYDDRDSSVWRPKVLEYSNRIKENRFYRNTIFLVQQGWRAINGNRLIGMKLLPERTRVFRFHNYRKKTVMQPSPSFREGLFHGDSTLTDCVNFAYILGWRQVILVGVDLYDRRYFWLDEDETLDGDIYRGASHEQHHRASKGLLNVLGRWDDAFQIRGSHMSVYNPRSLLAAVLPTTRRSDIKTGPRAVHRIGKQLSVDTGSDATERKLSTAEFHSEDAQDSSGVEWK